MKDGLSSRSILFWLRLDRIPPKEFNWFDREWCSQSIVWHISKEISSLKACKGIILEAETTSSRFAICLGPIFKPTYSSSKITFGMKLLGMAIVLSSIITFCPNALTYQHYSMY